MGGYVIFGLQTAKNSDTTTSYGVGALGRYYIGKDTEVVKHGHFFAEVTVGIGRVNVNGLGSEYNWSELQRGTWFCLIHYT